MKERLAVRFIKKRIAKITPTLADNDRINEIIAENTLDLTPNLKKLVQQRVVRTFKSIMEEEIKSHPELVQLIEKETKK